MSGTAAPQHEFEVLAARNMRMIAEHSLPFGWLTPAEADDLLIANVVDRAAGYAERAFLGAAGLSPKCADLAVASCIAELFAEAHRAADLLDLAPIFRTRLEVDAATRFDARVAELRAVAIHMPGNA